MKTSYFDGVLELLIHLELEGVVEQPRRLPDHLLDRLALSQPEPASDRGLERGADGGAQLDPGRHLVGDRCRGPSTSGSPLHLGQSPMIELEEGGGPPEQVCSALTAFASEAVLSCRSIRCAGLASHREDIRCPDRGSLQADLEERARAPWRACGRSHQERASDPGALLRIVVPDASALVEYLLRTQPSEWIGTAITDTDHDLHVPALCDVEVTAALRRAVLLGALEERRAKEAVEDYLDLRLTRHGHQSLIIRMLELRDNFSAYDAT